MTDAQIAYSIAKLKEYGIVDSGDALRLGIGAMTDARIKDFFDQMVKAGIVKPEHRLQEGLHAAVRRQGRRRRAPRRAAAGARRSAASVEFRAAGGARKANAFEAVFAKACVKPFACAS